ncbi:GH116 family glycosyl-hydrolase [Chryseolinea sp. T2]|uniref:GH116 family glycosyl-hydrolase n=1 Tax=Chryseolinea sp. T2 TaxID=3129255 RepID=UPI003076D20D
MRQSGLIAAGLLSTQLPLRATPVIADPILEKKLDKAWINSLFERGKATTYLKSKNELDFIGMPVGGIGCGCVYLGGDGRLWLWDVFNKNQTGVVYKNVKWHEKIQFNFDFLRPFDGANYVEPVKDVRPLEQGFAIRIESEGKTIIKRLQAEDWEEVSFEATYPMATVRYVDKNVPFSITLRAYSPFIPLNAEDSGLPVSILSFTIENKTPSQANVTLTGWLENKSSIYSADSQEYFRVNEGVKGEGFIGVMGTSNSYNWVDETFSSAGDYGNFCIASFNDGAKVNADASMDINSSLFDRENAAKTKIEQRKAIATVGNSVTVLPGKSLSLDFGIAWYFPNLSFELIKKEGGRYYANQFKSSYEVIKYVRSNFERLSGETKTWCDTWYDQSTLPYWFLERTFLNISTLSTTTVHRFQSGRFYAWEGVGSCPGTCNHVWQYAQAVGRIFPSLERDTRERVDLGLAFHDDGHIGFRGEYDTQPAIDGQAGRILGIFREHQMSADNNFLKRSWPKIRHALEFLLAQDTNGDGMTDTQLENTLDAKWPGEIAWIVGLTITAVKAGQRMAEEMDDEAFATKCKVYVSNGMANMEKHLYNGEYFIHRPDAQKGRTVIGSYNTCHIDQVYGQSWAHQVGLGRVLDKTKTLSALKALWKYNFTTDVGPYLKDHHGGRPYALAGEGGMIMNTNPKNEEVPYGVKDAWQVTYFHECMSGFEHQVAAHMMAEGMAEESLILTRAIHDRYHAAKRNPFNEVECSDHYARAMASYGTYITACGFTYHGPSGSIGFDPKLNKDNFKAAFTSAEGWGTYSHTKEGKQHNHHLDLKYGKLVLNNLLLKSDRLKGLTVALDNVPVRIESALENSFVRIRFPEPLVLGKGQTLTVRT